MNRSLFGRCALLLLFIPACASFNNLSAPRVSQIRETISATNQGSANITVAYEACGLWKTLLADPSDLSEDILATCIVLRASCLVRTGRDDQAIVEYSKALKLKHAMTKESYQEAVLGRGKSLQRLLKYEEAREQFLQLGTLESAVCAAATCALREGDTIEALKILRNFQESTNQSIPEASAMLSALDQSKTISDDNKECMVQSFAIAAKSLLYRWILFLQSKKEKKFDLTSFPDRKWDFTFFDLAKMNISPFDDYNLIHLDDKVLLHKLFSARNDLTRAFWPIGIVDASEMLSYEKEFAGTALWIHKRRSGYGSHGNQVLTSYQAGKLAFTLDGTSLLQKMVDPPLLVDGRKFSIRIYVVCFENSDTNEKSDVYIAREGLLKLASETVQAAESDSIDVRVHMTNSGRESVMTQRSLQYLENEVFVNNGWSYTDFWEKIKEVVRTTLDVYFDQVSDDKPFLNPKTKLSKLGIPKILGFDFVVDSRQNAWVVEVNRFPGLEARDESDRGVKESVLQDTWKLTIARAGLSELEVKAIFGDLVHLEKESSNENFCLEKI